MKKLLLLFIAILCLAGRGVAQSAGSVTRGASALPIADRRAPDPFEMAFRADDFVDRVGVATHWGYTDTPYGGGYERVRELLAASGIRHVRDGLHPRLSDLWARHGIRATVIASPGDVAQTLARLWEAAPYLAMIEGPNEVALFATSAQYKGHGFPAGPRAWTTDLRGGAVHRPGAAAHSRRRAVHRS